MLKLLSSSLLINCVIFSEDWSKHLVIFGRYTRNILDYELVIPKKLDTSRKFRTFEIPHFFQHDLKKRSTSAEPHVRYLITFNGDHHFLDLWPNQNLLSPDTIFESRQPKALVNTREIEKHDGNLCYYQGQVRDKVGSRAALSTCNGLAGYVIVNGKRFLVEPAADFVPNKRGQHLHVVYNGENKINKATESQGNCGTNCKWEEAWKQRFLNEFVNQEVPVPKRSLISIPRYLETLVVADKKFLDYHKNTDCNNYILTVMNMVSDFYHDSSSGHLMNVVVVRVMFLEKEEEEIDLTISANADETLASFCKWQQTVNPKDITHPNHHDIAVLLTRYDICADNMTNCGLMGLAYVASACTGDKPCAINEDGGLILGVVVAHEMGHVMGCSHDKEDESGCKPQASDQSYYVMSPFVHIHSNVWSTCSKTFITQLFDNNLGECLNDEPQESLYKDRNMLPGTLYDAEYQCNLAFPGSKVCGGDPEKFCAQILCQTSPTSCMSNGEPFADGTKCGVNKWCYDTKCVEIGSRPEAINGEWGDWGPWTKCSRTCGGGITYSERECNNPAPKHKGRYCLGERKRIKICNPHPCAGGAKSFRAVQCSDFDKKPFHGGLFKWEPFFREEEPCGLFCINQKGVYSKLSLRAKDGTKCKRGTKNTCVSGVCRKVGCDDVMDSDAIEDLCGICKGDGTQCKITDELFKGSPGHGYVKITTIIKGSRNVFVEEEAPSENTIAISAMDEKKFYLNGDFSEQQDGDHDFGGVEGIYAHPEPNKENLVIYGPLKEDIVLFVVYYKNENVGYHYKYAEPIAQNYQPVYHWEFVEWEDCSVRCGGGIETSEPSCLEAKAGKVGPSFCQGLEKPHPLTEKCNEQPCKTKWRIGKWSKCSACKFQSGIRIREVECIREAQKPGAEDTLVEDSNCPSPRPGTRELCNSHKKCAKTKRHTQDFPQDIMEHLWLQSMVEYMDHKPLSYKEALLNPVAIRRARRNIIKSRRARNSDKCSGEGKGNANATLKVGTIVQDKIPTEEIKLIEVPLKQSHLSLNLTDAAFETMGDKIADTLDICKKKVVTGKQAAEQLKKLQHKNQTVASDK